MTSQMAERTGQGRQRHNLTGGSSSAVLSTAGSVLCWLALLSVMRLPMVTADCWLIEGEKGFVWLAICSMNQPPYEAIPSHINRWEKWQWKVSFVDIIFCIFHKETAFTLLSTAPLWIWGWTRTRYARCIILRSVASATSPIWTSPRTTSATWRTERSQHNSTCRWATKLTYSHTQTLMTQTH